MVLSGCGSTRDACLQWVVVMLRAPGTTDLTPSPRSRGGPVMEVSCSHALLSGGLCSSRCWAAVAVLRAWRPLFLLVVVTGGSSSPVVPLGEGVGLGSGRVPMQACGVLGCWRGLGDGTWRRGVRFFVLIHGISAFSHLYGSILTFASADGGLGVCLEASQARTPGWAGALECDFIFLPCPPHLPPPPRLGPWTRNFCSLCFYSQIHFLEITDHLGLVV